MLFPLSRRGKYQILTKQLVSLFCVTSRVCRVGSCRSYWSALIMLSKPPISLWGPTHMYTQCNTPDTLKFWLMTCNFTLEDLLALRLLTGKAAALLIFLFYLHTVTMRGGWTQLFNLFRTMTPQPSAATHATARVTAHLAFHPYRA